MVRALLAGTKTQTRRVVKGARKVYLPTLGFEADCITDLDGAPSRLDIAPNNWGLCPYGTPGDLLWVRETCLEWRDTGTGMFSHVAAFAADGYQLEPSERWTPSIHMPRAASRLTLRITDVRVQRLQDISEEDSRAEGAAFTCPQCGNDLDDEHGAEVHAACDDDGGSHREGFHRVWQAINGLGSWDANPWAWALTFEVIKQNVDAVLASREAA